MVRPGPARNDDLANTLVADRASEGAGCGAALCAEYVRVDPKRHGWVAVPEQYCDDECAARPAVAQLASTELFSIRSRKKARTSTIS